MAEIWSYIAEQASETVATRFLDKLYATCERVLLFPLAHPERQPLAHGLRVALHAPYAIYYQFDDKTVTLVRVLHSARDLAAIAGQGGFGSA